MEGKKVREKVVYVLLVVFLAVIIWMFMNLSKGRTTFFGSAASSGVADTGNSYLFVSPVSARVGGDKVRVTTFVLDGQGKGVVGQSVNVVCLDPASCTNSGVLFTPVQQSTDTLGQAIWEMTANTVGKFTLQALVGGKAIPQTVTVDFR